MKEYSLWHNKKSELEQATTQRLFKEGEVWWCSIGLNIGYEADGKNIDFERPVLIIKKYSKDTFTGIPLTSKQKESKYYFPIKIKGITGSVNLSQSRLFSAKRLQRRMTHLSDDLVLKIRSALLDLLQ